MLIAGWFEPPKVGGLHASTLVQQILSVIAERGGATAADLWTTLVQGGPFGNLARDDFVELLRYLGEKELLVQESSGLLLHGVLGEKLVNHYEFYSAFLSDEEFRLVCDGRALGSLPVSRPLVLDQRIIFAGRRWRVLDVDEEKKLVIVLPDKGGAPPMFDGASGKVHDHVREEMRKVLAEGEDVPFVDAEGSKLLDEARKQYSAAGLATRMLVPVGSSVLLLTWRGDWTNDALALLLGRYGLSAANEGLAVRVYQSDGDRVLDALGEIADEDETDPNVLLSGVRNLIREKWDWALPEQLLQKSFASSLLDLGGAREVATSVSGDIGATS